MKSSWHCSHSQHLSDVLSKLHHQIMNLKAAFHYLLNFFGLQDATETAIVCLLCTTDYVSRILQASSSAKFNCLLSF